MRGCRGTGVIPSGASPPQALSPLHCMRARVKTTKAGPHGPATLGRMPGRLTARRTTRLQPNGIPRRRLSVEPGGHKDIRHLSLTGRGPELFRRSRVISW